MSELLNSKLRCLDKYDHMPQQDGTILVGILIGKANCKWKLCVSRSIRPMSIHRFRFLGILIGIPLALGMVFIYKRGCFGLAGNRGAAAYSRAFYKRAEAGDDFHI